MPRISKNPQERKEEIIDTAQQLFHEKGYQHTAISDIVKHIGVAQGTFYYYFKSKEEVAEAVINRHLTHILEPFKKIAESSVGTAYEKMKLMLKKELSEAKDHEDVFQYLHHEDNAILHQRLIVKMVRVFSPLLAVIFEQGVSEGDFVIQDPNSTAEFFLTGLQFWLDEALFQWTAAERHTRIESVGAILGALLGARPGLFDYKGWLDQ